jgi:hypothetical protein
MSFWGRTEQHLCNKQNWSLLTYRAPKALEKGKALKTTGYSQKAQSSEEKCCSEMEVLRTNLCMQ